MRKLKDPFIEYYKYRLEICCGLKKFDKRKWKRIIRRNQEDLIKRMKRVVFDKIEALVVEEGDKND